MTANDTGLLTNERTNQTTPHSRVFRDKLTVPLLLKKLRVVYGNRMFITVYKTARHFSHF
jgi:hypothetical protein